jgi:Na+/proline symporter
VHPGFSALDWAVVSGVLIAATWVAARRAGHPADLREFFLGGRRLPWPAVSASIIATEISAVTYVSLPSVVFRDGGDLTYLQLGLIGSLIARVIVAWRIIPAYYAHDVYSPYDFIGLRLGEPARRAATALFTLGGLLGQAARVYLTGVVLEVVLHEELLWLESWSGVDPLVAAIALIGCVAIGWTWMGGIATVVWTDAVLFFAFLAGLGVALWTLSVELDAGLGGAVRAAGEAGKLRLIDASLDPGRAYTLWAALFAASWAGVGSYGTDQLLAQRLLCCRGVREARRAMLASYGAMGITLLVALLGVGLWAYYQEHAMSVAGAARVAAQPDRVFPVFVLEVLRPGLRGLVLAGAFAAAISSLDSILAALAQTTLAVWRGPAASVRTSRGVVLGWGVLLCAGALALEPVARHFSSLLDLALAMASYTGGALLAGVWLALRRDSVDASGYVWSAPLSALAVFSVAWHAPAAQAFSALVCGATALAWLALRVRRGGLRAEARSSLALFTLLAAILALTSLAWAPGEVGPRSLAWPWWIPLGSVFAYVGALALRRRGDASLHDDPE